MNAARAHPWLPSGPFMLLTGACLACFLAFVHKAFHMDDPLFLWTAKQIHAHPMDFYGFRVNWYLWDMPMAEVTKNPPLASYYIALVALIGGWSESTLHLGLILPALGVVWGTYCLASDFGVKPLPAALATLATPAFLVCSTTVMSDTLMVCFWVWALVAWNQGLSRHQARILFLAGLLIALAGLTKYFGFSLVPLLSIYALLKTKKIGIWLLALLVPVGALLGYQELTHVLYGQDLLFEAAAYSTGVQVGSGTRISLIPKLIVGLSFVGGGTASVLFYLPCLWSGRALRLGLVLLAGLAVGLATTGTIGPFPLIENSRLRWEIIVQLCVFCAGGLAVLALAATDLWNQRDARSLLLFLWVAGTFVFAVFVNWTINARSLLPLVPAVGILVMRRLENLRALSPETGSWRLLWPLTPAVGLALLVADADARLADTARASAESIQAIPRTGKLWFQGHWGFQYYMQELAGCIVDAHKVELEPGDLLVIPENNYGLMDLPQGTTRLVDRLNRKPFPGVSTMDRQTGAGFYVNRWGPLPFAFGPGADEEYQVYRIIAPFHVDG
jgi:4-amino-4-deoxy-L-arabinose transferase-like glycosyltransferase